MYKKTTVFLTIAVFSGFLFFANNSQAASCSYSCGSNEKSVDQVYCNIACVDGMVCCEANAATPAATSGTNTGPCAGQSDGTVCTQSNGASGSCSSGDCVAPYTGGGGGSGSSFPSGSGSGGSASGNWSLGNISGFGLPSGTISAIIINLLLWILGIFGAIGILGFIISGVLYLTSAGNDERMELAKKAMLYSIIGVIVGLVGFVIIQAVDMALNAMSSF